MAVILKISKDDTVEEARIAPGSVFPNWLRVTEAEQFLSGKKVSAENFEQAGKIVADKMIEISGKRWSTPYKEPVVAALVRRTLQMAAGRL
jgi:carbon-monoxide dehydrogenase medium subunit/xanthine dehydrogenase FAD-binding subunit